MNKKSIILTQNNLLEKSNIKLLVNGQGVFVFSNKDNTSPISLFFYNGDKSDGLHVIFTLSSVFVHSIKDNKNLIDINNKNGLSNVKGAYYWFSIDCQNQKIYAGIGEPRLETNVYKYFLNHNDKSFLESINQIEIAKESKYLKQLLLLRDPITSLIPLLVKNTDDLTMNDIAQGSYMPKSNLSLISQKLYDCISGKKFILNDKDFPDFSKAIEYSIITDGNWCNKKLKDKSTEFSKIRPNILETYLRITLGTNNGESPGIPYVMEIWPIGHYSPIHSHAGSNAIIRVLHGKINVKLYPFLSGQKDGVEHFSSADFSENEITWISPTLNQTHKLMNDKSNTKTCITIQCYMYDNENSTHYDFFDYLDENSEIQKYEPDSDMDFVSFKELMKKEWNNRVL
jgi:hypothetical protein